MNVEIGGHTKPEAGYLQVDVYGSPDLRADIRALPFRHSLDRIFVSHVLEHLPGAEIVGALKSCRGAIRPGGTLEVYVPDFGWILRKFQKASIGERWAFWEEFIFGEEGPGMQHRSGFSTKRLSDCLVAAGFRTVKVRRKRREDRRNLMEIHAIAIV